MNTLLFVCGLLGTVMVGYGIWSFTKLSDTEASELDDLLPFFLSFPPDDEGVLQADLVDVSSVWKGDVINFRTIAKIWREQAGEEIQDMTVAKPSFTHEEITRFYNDIVEPQRLINGARKCVITKILKMLDTEGMCSSVVRGSNKIKDPDTDYGDSTFMQLATVPLYMHSLAVAYKFISITSEEILLPTVLIAALGHDLGKIPKHHSQYYSTGDHPQISLIVLASIPEYTSLANRNELDRIIRGHHQMSPSNPLAVALKQCDQEVRSDELGAIISRSMELTDIDEIELDETEEEKADHDAQAEETQEEVASNPAPPLPTEPAQAPTPNDQMNQHEATDHPLGSEPKVKYKPKTVSLGLWYDADNILALIKRQVNQVDRTASGVQWLAVSMPNGMVYVRPEGLWNAIQETCAGRDASILTAAGDEAAKRDFIFTVVWNLGKTKDATAIEMMAKSYYTIKTAVISDNDKVSTWSLIPFRSSAFGVLPSEFESTKPAILKKLVKEIKLKEAGK